MAAAELSCASGSKDNDLQNERADNGGRWIARNWLSRAISPTQWRAEGNRLRAWGSEVDLTGDNHLGATGAGARIERIEKEKVGLEKLT